VCGGEGDREVLSDRNLIPSGKKTGFKSVPGRVATYQVGSDQAAPGGQADQVAR
jgi:hypothetical protein